MRGKVRAFFRRHGKRLAVWLPVLIFYCSALLSYGEMQREPATVVFLSSAYPDQHSVKEILDQEAKADSPKDVCFYWDGGIKTVREPEFERQTQINAVGILGDAALYDWRINNFSEEDKEGCVLDEKTALELFKTRNAEGRTLLLQDREYQVRRVIPWGQRILLFRPTDASCVYTRVFVKLQNSGNRQKTAEQFLMSYGLAGTVVEERLLKGTALISLCLLPGAWFMTLWLRAVRERKQCVGEKAAYWLWTGICAALCMLIFTALWKYVRIPADWLPGKWSDFQFWPEKFQEESENLRLYLMMPKTVIQTENTIACFRTTVFSLAAFVIYLL